MVWRDYKDKYGRCEVESAPFECKICGRVVKYDRNTVHTHLKNVHGINWAMYLDRIRRMRRGEIPEDLPAPETHECRVCNVSVKYLKEHLKNAHKITEQEYESLFEDDVNSGFEMKPSSRSPQTAAMPKPPPLTPKPQLKTPRQPTPEVMLPLLNAHDPTLPKPPKSDIQDKTNKTCSSCTITYDSRRSFIEHCTTVHNMRFKTKSGVTISKSSVQNRLQEEALKRSKEMAEQQEQQQQQQQPHPEQVNPDGSIIGKSSRSGPQNPFKIPQDIHSEDFQVIPQVYQQPPEELQVQPEIFHPEESQGFEYNDQAFPKIKIKNVFSSSQAKISSKGY